MKTSKAGKDLIKRSESLSLTPYLCPAKIPTIGYGTTIYPNGKKVKMTDPVITIEQAEEFFNYNLSEFEAGVEKLVKVPITQGQFDALVSFAYNVGLDIDEDTKAEGLGDSTLLRLFNAGDIAGAANQFLLWNKANGIVLPGLVRRRKAEQALFLSVS